MAENDIDGAKERLADADIEAGLVLLHSADAHVSEARELMADIQFVRVVPVVAKQYRAATSTVNAAHQVNASLISALEGVQGIEEVIDLESVENFAGLGVDDKKAFLKQLHQVAPRFEGALAELELAELEIEKIPSYGVLRQIKGAGQ